jgi:hypothetical protein
MRSGSWIGLSDQLQQVARQNDHRVKPGGDEGNASLFENRIRKRASRRIKKTRGAGDHAAGALGASMALDRAALRGCKNPLYTHSG